MRSATPSRFPGRPAKRLTILLGVRDRHRHSSLETELLKHARKAKLAGATVFEGEMGFGSSGQVHRGHLMSDDRPLAIVIIDEPHQIDAYLAGLGDLSRGIAATVEDIEVLDL